MIATGDAANPKTPKDADAKEMAQKGSYSDAFKRAAVKWGVGRYLYALDAPWVDIEKRGNSYVLPKASEAYLRKWLAHRLGMDVPPLPQQPQPPEGAPEKEAPAAPKGPSEPKPSQQAAASVPAASPAATPRHAVLVGDGAGRIGLDGIHRKVLGIVAKLDSYGVGPLKGVLTKIDKAHAEWLVWRDMEAAGMTDSQRRQVDTVMAAFAGCRAKIAAAITQQEQVAEHPDANPATGELRYEPVEGAA
jgi:hypothetical protein